MIKTHITVLPGDTTGNSAFLNWISEYCTCDMRILDIGAGHDREKIDASIQPHVACLVGIDPSEDILKNPSVHEGYRMSLEDFAESTQEQFDIVFCKMVLEHVSNPNIFFSACRQLLKPGGMFFAITPNLWHYFGLTTKATLMLGINEWLLERLIGKQAKDAYHFPTTYKINSIHAIRNMLTKTGFHEVEFCCLDNWIGYRYVIPKPLHWFPRLYSRFAYRLKMPHLMGTIMFKATL